ncbi:MAG: hypothetical protein U0L42_09370 [Methanobrevibacter sp.]|uniref:hypothetical protein n=1 Tax=Methanobrevibacter sp. TaxID=66852 RepID=UPI002E78A107|nr:hypothetical protein [Methanobrevibacter sp.]MEE0935870.1 hypothetical protein [Methanobrevibacter sp.]
MDIKYILGALVVIFLIGNIFFIYENQFSNQSDSAIIGDKSFELPNNYSSNKLEISNGANSIFIFKSGTIPMDSAIKAYETEYSDNFTIHVYEFNSKFPSKKTVATDNNNESIIKYWFEIDNNLYQIQFFSSNKKTNFDDTARNIINSMS